MPAKPGIKILVNPSGVLRIETFGVINSRDRKQSLRFLGKVMSHIEKLDEALRRN